MLYTTGQPLVRRSLSRLFQSLEKVFREVSLHEEGTQRGVRVCILALTWPLFIQVTWCKRSNLSKPRSAFSKWDGEALPVPKVRLMGSHGNYGTLPSGSRAALFRKERRVLPAFAFLRMGGCAWGPAVTGPCAVCVLAGCLHEAPWTGAGAGAAGTLSSPRSASPERVEMQGEGVCSAGPRGGLAPWRQRAVPPVVVPLRVSVS